MRYRCLCERVCVSVCACVYVCAGAAVTDLIETNGTKGELSHGPVRVRVSSICLLERAGLVD